MRDADSQPQPGKAYWERAHTVKSNRLAVGLLWAATAVLFVGMAPVLVVLAVRVSPWAAVAGLLGFPILIGVLNRIRRSVLEHSEVDIEDRLVGWPKRDAVEITGYTRDGLPLYSTKISTKEYWAFMVVGFLMAIGTLLIFALAYEPP